MLLQEMKGTRKRCWIDDIEGDLEEHGEKELEKKSQADKNGGKQWSIKVSTSQNKVNYYIPTALHLIQMNDNIIIMFKKINNLKWSNQYFC